jgi:hypothetical protein
MDGAQLAAELNRRRCAGVANNADQATGYVSR